MAGEPAAPSFPVTGCLPDGRAGTPVLTFFPRPLG